MSVVNAQPWPGASDDRPANGAHAGAMPRWATASATIASFATQQVAGHRDIYVPLATASLAGAQAAADKAKLDAIADIAGYFIGLRAHNSSNISIPNAAATSLTFDTNDTLGSQSTGLHSTTSNTNQFSAGVAGWYRLTAHVAFAASAGGTIREVTLVRSSGTIIAQADSPPLGAGNPVALPPVVALDYYAAGEWCQIKAYQDSGGALNALTLANRGLYVTWERVGL
jgi:hypothetical protein